MNGELKVVDKQDAMKLAFANRLKDAQVYYSFLLHICYFYKDYKDFRSNQLHFHSFLQHDIPKIMRSVVMDISVKKHSWTAYNLHLLANKKGMDVTIVYLHELLMDVKTGLCMAFLALENGLYWPLACQMLRWKDEKLIVENKVFGAKETKLFYSYLPKKIRRKFKLDRNKNIQI